MPESAWGLKPCPFCGGTKLIMESEPVHLDDIADGLSRIVCDATQGGCGASCGWYNSMMGAVEAWNRRSNDGTV